MKWVALVIVVGLILVPVSASAQRDSMRMGESFGAEVKKAPIPLPPSVVPPSPLPAPVAQPTVTVAVPQRDDTKPVEGSAGSITAELFASVKRAPGQIRDVVTFMAGWGGWGPTPAEFQPVVGSDLKVAVAGHSLPMKDVRLVSARGYSTIRNESGSVVGARINEVVVKLARGWTRGPAQLTLAPRDGGYVVTAVTITTK